MSECYFHVKAIYGVTEDCFEIESQKSPSFFIIISRSSSQGRSQEETTTEANKRSIERNQPYEIS